jgi:ribosomal protein RSM22 (predicted rRNA methylase)
VAAYLAYRAPATFAAAAAVFRQVAALRPEWQPQSLLDVGAGPGAATWAALELWPSLKELTLLEVEPEMRAAGRELLPDARWVEGDVSQARGPADLVVASYVLGELPDPRDAAAFLWRQSAHTLAVIEPGTPNGYRNVLAARGAVVGAGGHTVAPCPHDLACPLQPDDWCHFAVRLPRSKLHRRAKSVELGFEDEKFSYVVVAHGTIAPAAARIIRQPQIRSGHVNLVTCEPDGVHDRTISRRHGDRYKEARRAAWGDAIGPPPAPRP